MEYYCLRQGGRRQGRRTGDLQSIVPAGFEVGGVTGIGLSGKEKHSGNNEGSFHVSTLEV